MSAEEGVTYSFKDLFEKLDSRLAEGFDKLDKRMDKFEQRLETKADNSRVAGLEKRMADHEIRVEERFKPLELAGAGVTAVSSYKWAAMGLAVAALTAISTLVWLASGGH